MRAVLFAMLIFSTVVKASQRDSNLPLKRLHDITKGCMSEYADIPSNNVYSWLPLTRRQREPDDLPGIFTRELCQQRDMVAR